MKVLDAGTEQLTNTDVLNWIKLKREQYVNEDANDHRRGAKKIPRPGNFMDSLKKHEQVLSAAPHNRSLTKQTLGSGSRDGYAKMHKLEDMICQRFVLPVDEKYKDWREKGMTQKQMEKKLQEEQDAKSLTETELLMIENHAPVDVQMLEPLVENIDDRFSKEEQEVLCQMIKDVYREKGGGG